MSWGDRSGYFAQTNDPISELFRAFLNRLLRSVAANVVLLGLFSAGAFSLGWNTCANQYVLARGQRTTVPVLDEQWDDSFASTRFQFFAAGERNTLRLFADVFRPSGLASDVGVATTSGCRRDCATGQRHATIAYLPDSPGNHLLTNDAAIVLEPLFAVFCLLISYALCWNLIRLQRGGPALAIPSWPERARRY